MYFKRVIYFRNPKTKVKMKNAVYPEQAILDLTKIFMNGFHYDYMHPVMEVS